MTTLANFKKLENVSNISVNNMDRTIGIKTGVLDTFTPTYTYKMYNGIDKNGNIKTTEPKPYDMADIVLIERRKDKNGQWYDKELPTFSMNFKSVNQETKNRINFYSMLFRNCTSKDIVDEMTSGELRKSKALASILQANGIEPNQFVDMVKNLKTPITFAQYKRDNGQLNFVDADYYNQNKVESTTEVEEPVF
tara:strand:+ start:77 stop:658 length:582 start_codon:yes stop_codon:yes gene_type:complete